MQETNKEVAKVVMKALINTSNVVMLGWCFWLLREVFQLYFSGLGQVLALLLILQSLFQEILPHEKKIQGFRPPHHDDRTALFHCEHFKVSYELEPDFDLI